MVGQLRNDSFFLDGTFLAINNNEDISMHHTCAFFSIKTNDQVKHVM